jgi:ABC-2 type transport system permease protein
MADWVQVVSLVNPVRHFVTIARALLVRGASLPDILTPLSILVASAVALLALAIRQYSKRTA